MIPVADDDKMMFVRPKNCQWCGNGYYALYHVVQYAQQLNQWEITDLSAEQAKKQPVYDALDTTNPGSFYGFGHGHNCRFTGDDTQDIFTCDECEKLQGRIVYLLSCLTANGLGPAIIQKGAVAYAGFNISWSWITNNPDGDPYDDIYALGFWESANELWVELLNGGTFIQAIQASIARYNWWIDYWWDNSSDPNSQSCIMWLIHDRDGLVGFLNADDETACYQAGGTWIDDICYTHYTEKQLSSGTLVAACVIGLLCFVFIAGKR